MTDPLASCLSKAISSRRGVLTHGSQARSNPWNDCIQPAMWGISGKQPKPVCPCPVLCCWSIKPHIIPCSPPFPSPTAGATYTVPALLPPHPLDMCCYLMSALFVSPSIPLSLPSLTLAAISSHPSLPPIPEGTGGPWHSWIVSTQKALEKVENCCSIEDIIYNEAYEKSITQACLGWAASRDSRHSFIIGQKG